MERVKDRGGSFGPGQALIYIANDAKPAVINLHNGCCARERTVRICLGGETGSGDRSGSTTPFSILSLFLRFLFPSSRLFDDEIIEKEREREE